MQCLTLKFLQGNVARFLLELQTMFSPTFFSGTIPKVFSRIPIKLPEEFLNRFISKGSSKDYFSNSLQNSKNPSHFFFFNKCFRHLFTDFFRNISKHSSQILLVISTRIAPVILITELPGIPQGDCSRNCFGNSPGNSSMDYSGISLGLCLICFPELHQEFCQNYFLNSQKNL